MNGIATLFDYGALDVETRIVVQQKAGEIKNRAKRVAQDMVEIGERLIDVKERLGHGRFGKWLELEFRWSEQTARNLMNVADAFKSTNFGDLDVDPSALYALAAPSVPEIARTEAIDMASHGQRLTHADAKAIVEKHKPDRPDAHTAKAAPATDDTEIEEEAESREPDPTPEEESQEAVWDDDLRKREEAEEAEEEEEEDQSDDQGPTPRSAPCTELFSPADHPTDPVDVEAQAKRWKSKLLRLRDDMLLVINGICNDEEMMVSAPRWFRDDIKGVEGYMAELRDAADHGIKQFRSFRKCAK